MRTKHNDGKVTFTPDMYEKRCADTVTDMATTISVLATGDLQQQAKGTTVAVARLMAMIAEAAKAKPETITGELAEQSPKVVADD